MLVGLPNRARPLLEKAIALYGATAQTRRLEAWLDHLIANPLEETSEDLLRSPPASPEAMARFLGVWEGRLQGTIPVEVIFAVETGRVVGRTVQTLPDGKKGVFEHVMARVPADGTVEWGYTNKTRPYSLVLAYRATLSDENTLVVSGKETMSPPPGRSRGGFHLPFTLTRKKE